MTKYASQTQVSADQSVAEIKRIIRRYGASDFAYLERDDLAAVSFVVEQRHVRFAIDLPDAGDRAFTRTPTGRARTASAARDEWQKAVRQRWRALALIIKAKLEAVESRVAEFDQEFFPYLVLANGQTVFEHVGAQAIASIETGTAPRLQIEAGG